MANVEAITVKWSDFIRELKWKQGEHVILIGPNGSGKTVINKHLLRYRMERNGYICVFVTKPIDDELEELRKKRHFIRIADNNNWGPTSYPRILLWPPAGEFRHRPEQRRVFLKALSGMWKKGSWAICLNELRYLTEMLKLKDELNTLYLQIRTSKCSLSAETQRPRHVPLEAFSQSTHDFFGPCRDDEDLKRISGIGNADSKVIRRVVAQLNPEKYQFCYVNAKTGLIVVTRATPFRQIAA